MVLSLAENSILFKNHLLTVIALRLVDNSMLFENRPSNILASGLVINNYIFFVKEIIASQSINTIWRLNKPIRRLNTYVKGGSTLHDTSSLRYSA